MRTNWNHIEQYRVQSGAAKTEPGERFGQFIIPFNAFTTLCVIATEGDPLSECPDLGEAGKWEHVSTHTRTGKKMKEQRTPTWTEMCHVRDLFWTPEECVMQLHPPRSEYVNQHEHTLHLWRPIFERIPTPPTICV